MTTPKRVAIIQDGIAVEVKVDDQFVAYFSGPGDIISVKSLLTHLNVPYQTYERYR